MKYVYLMRAGKGHYKVGVASNVSKRLIALQTGNPMLVEVVTAKLTERPHDVEMALHLKLKEFHTNGGKEWFNLTDKEALELAVLIHKDVEIDVSDKLLIKAILTEQKSNTQLIVDCLSNVERALAHIEPKPPVIIEKTIARPKRHIPTLEEELDRAIAVIKENGKASTSLLQRKLSMGYGKAARIMDELEQRGYISGPDGIRPRELLV